MGVTFNNITVTVLVPCHCLPGYCHWWGLPQVSHVCCDKTHLLSQQKCACRDKTFVMTKIFCHDKHNFAATKVLSWQSYFVVTKDLFCRDNRVFVVTKMMLAAAPANGKIHLGILNATSKSKKPTPVCCRLRRMCARLCRPSRPCCTARPSRSPRQSMCPSWPWRCTRTTCCCCLCSTSAGLSLR